MKMKIGCETLPMEWRSRTALSGSSTRRLWRYFVPTKPPNAAGQAARAGSVLSGLSRVFKRVLRAFAVSTQRRTFGAKSHPPRAFLISRLRLLEIQARIP